MRLEGKFIHLVRVVIFRLSHDLCFLRASALTFYALLAIGPLLAVLFGIARGFGFGKMVQELLQREFQGQPEIGQYFLGLSEAQLAQAGSGVVVGIGVAALLYTILQLLEAVESTINAMWGLANGRPFMRRISDYLALILLCPILLAISSSLAVMLTTSAEAAGGGVEWLILTGLAIVPYVLSMALFVFLYAFLPNTRVQWSAALLAGCIAGVVYQVAQSLYISTQVVLAHSGSIYGGFAALPLFLLWLYVSWVVFLIGAEVAVIMQERSWDPRVLSPLRTLSGLERDMVLLALTREAVDAFIKGKPPLRPDDLARRMRLPTRIVTELLEVLIDAKVCIKTAVSKGNDWGVCLARSPDTLRVYDVIDAVHGEDLITEVEARKALLPWGKVLEAARQRSREAEQLLVRDV